MRSVPLVVTLLLLAAAAAAHGPPAKRDQDFRLLADHNDDCGGHSATDPDRCNGTHDLVGLDLREAHDAALGDLVYFRFILNGGSGALRDVLTMKAGGATKTFELRTSDNQAFEGTGFATFSKEPARNADGSQDGTRFVVEAGVPLATLGQAGVKLTEYVVESFRGSTRGDYMPGGYSNALGSKVEDPEQGDAVTNFARTGGYVLQGPAYYVQTVVPAIDVPAGSSVEVEVHLANQLRSTPQTATLLAGASPGVTATWKESGTATTTVDLAKGGSVIATLRIEAGADAHGGDLEVTVTTNLGGRTVQVVPVEVGPSQGTATPTTGSKGNDAPAPAAALTALGLLAFAALRRRR